MLVYKVVRTENDRFLSLMVKGKLEVEYQIAKITKPKIGCLMAFADYEQAVLFQYLTVPAEYILLCEAKVSSATRPRFLIDLGGWNWNIEMMKDFWNDASSVNSTLFTFENKYWGNLTRLPIPPGTVFCKWIKPLEVL